MRIAIPLVLLSISAPAVSKKLPLRSNVPEVTKSFWVVKLRLRTGELAITSATRRRAKKARTIYKMAGPYRLLLVGRRGELATYDFTFPLLGPGEPDPLLVRGLSAETEIYVADRKGLTGLVAIGPNGKKARRALRRSKRRIRRRRKRSRRGRAGPKRRRAKRRRGTKRRKAGQNR